MLRDDSENKMTFQEKIDYIDHEIRLLHQFCLQTGYSPQKINEFAEPFMNELNKTKRESYNRLFIIASLIALVSGILGYGIAYHPSGQAAIRLTMVKLYPLYEWIQVHQQDCLIRNPLYIDQYVTEADCELCDGINTVIRISDTTEQEFVEKFMKNGIHVIVKDGMKNWPESLKSLTVDKFRKTYSSDPAFHNNEPCEVSSNLPRHSVHQFLQDESSFKDGFYMSWTNCVKQAAKAMRRFYKRPYFLPSSVEMFEQNFIYFSKEYEDEHVSELKSATAIIILQQIKGSSKFFLVPEEVCNKTCVQIEDTLHKGEILVAMNTHKLWTLEIQGIDEKENIAIGVEGNYN